MTSKPAAPSAAASVTDDPAARVESGPGTQQGLPFTGAHAQTNIQLYAQMAANGYAEDDIRRAADAYDLAVTLFCAAFRPSGRPFINHLVGTASLGAALQVNAAMVLALLLHAAYSFGDFGGWRRAPTPRHRRLLRGTVGEAAEAYIAAYTELSFKESALRRHYERLDTLTTLERDVIAMRLINELDEYRDLGMLYRASGEHERALARNLGPLQVELAKRLEIPALAGALATAFEQTVTREIDPALRPDRDGLYRMTPLSCRRRLGPRLAQRVARAYRRLRRDT